MGGINPKPQKAGSLGASATAKRHRVFPEQKDDQLTHENNEAALDEAWDYKASSFPDELANLVLDYVGGQFNYLSSQYPPRQPARFTLFHYNPYKSLEIHEMAVLTAKYVLLGKAEKVLELVQRNPSILLYKIPKVVDPIKRPLLNKTLNDNLQSKTRFRSVQNSVPYQIIPYKNKTILQIVAAEGDVDCRELSVQDGPVQVFPSEEGGLLEKLLPFVTPKEAHDQLIELFPTNWLAETNNWLQPYQNAVQNFIDTLILIKISESSNWGAKKWDELRCKIKPTMNAMWTLRQAFTAAATREVTVGFRLSMQVQHMTIQLMRANLDTLGGWGSLKSNFCATIFYGFLQELSLACDAPFIFDKGMHESYFLDDGTRVSHDNIKYALGDKYYQGRRGHHYGNICNSDFIQDIEIVFQVKSSTVCKLIQELRTQLENENLEQSGFTAAGSLLGK